MRFKNYMIIEEVNKLHMNDLMKIMYTNTISAMRWFLTRVLNKVGR